MPSAPLTPSAALAPARAMAMTAVAAVALPAPTRATRAARTARVLARQHHRGAFAQAVAAVRDHRLAHLQAGNDGDGLFRSWRRTDSASQGLAFVWNAGNALGGLGGI